MKKGVSTLKGTPETHVIPNMQCLRISGSNIFDDDFLLSENRNVQTAPALLILSDCQHFPVTPLERLDHLTDASESDRSVKFVPPFLEIEKCYCTQVVGMMVMALDETF